MFKTRTIADATMEANESSLVNDSASLRVAAWKAMQAGGWRAVRVLMWCMALVALLLGGVRLAQAQVVLGGAQSQIAAGTWTGPVGVATDSKGNIYVAEFSISQIVEIDAVTHTPTVITGLSGLSGPQQLAIDSSDNLYIADQGNNRIVKWSTTSNTVVASWPVPAPFAVAYDPIAGAIWIGSSGTVWVINSGTLSGTEATEFITGLVNVWGIAIDSSDNMWVADNAGWPSYSSPGAVYENPVSGLHKVLSVPGGVGQLVLDSAQNLYVAEPNVNSVYKFPLTGGTYTTANASLVSNSVPGAEAVAEDGNGNLFLTAFNSGTANAGGVTEISTQTAAFPNQNVGTTSSPLTFNFNIAAGTTIQNWLGLDQGISGLEFNLTGSGGSACGTGTYASDTACTVSVTFKPNSPGVRHGAIEAVDNLGNVLVTAYVSGVGLAPQVALHPGAQSTVVTGLISTWGNNFVVLPDGSFVAAAYGMSGLIKQAPGGAPADLVASGGLKNVNGLAVDGAGNIFVAQAWPTITSILEIPLAGTGYGTPFTVGSGLSSPNGVAVDGAGNLFVTQGSTTVTELPWTGSGYGTAVQFGSLVGASSVAVDAGRNVFVADSSGQKVVEIPWSGSAYGTQTTIASGFTDPIGIAVDAGGSIYVGDGFGDAGIRVIPQTASGYGTPVVIATGLGLSTGVALDGAGNLYVSRGGPGAITEINVASPQPVTFATPTELGVQDVTDLPTPTLTMLNTGNQDLNIFQSAYPTGFAYDAGSTCDQAPYTVHAGNECTYEVDFIPTVVGTNSGNLTLSDNSLNATSAAPATQNWSLTGTGFLTLAFGTPPAASIGVNGNAGIVRIDELDGSNNIITTATDSITLAVTGPNGYSASYTKTALYGVATFNLIGTNLGALGAYSYTASLTNTPTVVTAAPASETVSQATPTLTITGQGTTNVDASVTFTATLSGVPFTPTVPTGTVSFKINGYPSADCPAVAINANQQATCTTSSLHAGTDTVDAAYQGDLNFQGASAAQANQTVNSIPVTVGLTSGGASKVNDTVAFTAKLAGVPASPALAPAGNVTFSATIGGAATTICSSIAVANVGGTWQATCYFSMLVAPSDAISATYASDINYTAASAGAMTQTVAALTPTLSVTPSPSGSINVDQSATFTAQLSPVAFNPIVPRGTVSFTINGISNADCPAVQLTGGATSATCTTSGLIVPADIVVATYTGDTNFVVAAPGQTTETVSKVPAHTVLASSPVSPSVNQSVTLTATITPSAGGIEVLPSGAITFSQGSTTLCSQVVISAGVARCTYVFTSANSGASLSAGYSGDSNFTTGSAGTLVEVVNASSTTTVVTSPNNNQSNVNQQVTFTATVTPTYTAGTAAPTGTVTFVDQTTAATLCAAVPLTVNGTTGTATCNNTFTSSATNAVVATYTSADTNFNGSVSSTLNQIVSAASTTVTLSSSLPAGSTVNEQVTFTAPITYSAGVNGTATPNGTMTYKDGATILCTKTLASGVVPPCAVPLLTVGTHSITASFLPADTDFTAGTSNTVSQGVTQTATTTTVITTVNGAASSSSYVNEQVTFTATIAQTSTGQLTGTASPSGTVAFNYTLSGQPSTLCSAAAVSTSAGATTAVCTVQLPSDGAYAVTAVYAGDSSFLGGSSAPVIQNVNVSTPTVVVTATTASSSVNQLVTFTATVTPPYTGKTLPGGTVTFTDNLNGQTLCNAAPVRAGSNGASTATCNFYPTTANTHGIVATYSGDSNFGTLASSVYNEIVSAVTTALTPTPVSANLLPTQPLTFSVLVTPAPASKNWPPTGTVAFTANDANPPRVLCAAAAVTSNGDGTGTAVCPASFPLTDSNAYAVTAIYTDPAGNFGTSNTQSAVTVQSFSVAFNSPANSLILTQGYSNVTTPFAQPPVTVGVTSSIGYSHALQVSCTVSPVAVQSVSNPSYPSCSPETATMSGASGQTISFTVSASTTAPIGSYNVTFSAFDPAAPGDTQIATLPLFVQVLSSPVIVVEGAGTTITASALFNTAAATSQTTLTSFACNLIWDQSTTVDKAFSCLDAKNNPFVTITGPTGGVTVTPPSQLIELTATFSATATMAAVEKSSTIYAAAFLGIPLFALVGWFGSRKSPRRNFFRFLGLILLFAGISYAAGCGGNGFVRPSSPTSTGGLTHGNYLVQVVAYDQNDTGKTKPYYAVVPLVVNSAN